ncbi:MAG: hypothetical protein MK180_04675 [Rhodobacteraceae bacterium]|nr:hypothetical protein [Paracoccaceae bacterium]
MALATELLKAAKKANLLPETASSGKFPTVRLFWQNGRIEVEVFPGSFELYFLPSPNEGEVFSIVEFKGASVPEVLEKIKVTISRASS